MNSVFSSAAPWGAIFLAQSEGTPQLTLLDYLKSGGLVGWFLIVLSFVALALIIMNLIRLRRSTLLPDQLVREMDRRAREHDIQGLVELCNAPECDSSATRVLGPALKHAIRSQFGLLELRTAVEESGKKEMDRLIRPTELIGLIAAVGPMLGLLGTVIGMIGAFGTIGSLEGAARSRELAMFMSMALVATAEGLVVAIPCTVAYALFKRKTETIGVEVGDLMDDWVGVLQSAEPATSPAAPAPRPIPQPRQVPPAPPAPAARGVRSA
jgi:biopolymer transport protein ExbB